MKEDEKKAIEETAKAICETCKRDGNCSATICSSAFVEAEALYNAGYRKQEWISVDERLPVREGKYLVCTTNGNIGGGNFIDYYGKGTHLCFDCWAVTHWMPLPEPPKMKGGAE